MLIPDLIRHFFVAKNLHGTHSPYIYKLYDKVFNEDIPTTKDKAIEELRSQLKSDASQIDFIDFGAKGSITGKVKNAKVSTIARNSLKAPKWSRALGRLATFGQCNNILEFGTSLGITTAYLASKNTESKVVTLEGDPSCVSIAKQNWKTLEITNIEVVEGEITSKLLAVLQKLKMLDFVFIDANHSENATLTYYNEIIPYLHEDSIVVFDDIYWSQGMKSAWQHIKKHTFTRQTLDFYHIGIVLFRKNQAREHFKLKY